MFIPVKSAVVGGSSTLNICMKSINLLCCHNVMVDVGIEQLETECGETKYIYIGGGVVVVVVVLVEYLLKMIWM
jgi:hypothetical protein